MIDLNLAPDQVETLPWDQTKRLLLAGSAAWVPKVFPHARRGENGDWRIADITGRAPRKGGSLKIDTKAKAIDEFAFEFEPTIYRGYDPVGLLRDHFHLEGRQLFDRCNDIIDRYSGRATMPVPAAGPSEPIITHVNAQDDRIEKSEATAREIAYLVDRSTRTLGGTPAATYYSARGLALPECDDLYFNADALPFPHAPVGHPTIIALVRTPNGELTGGVHRTLLKPDGSWHIGGDRPKMMLGPCRGGMIQFEAVGDGELLLGEGPESTLGARALYQHRTGKWLPCWSAMTAGGMGSFGQKTGLTGGLAGWLLANRDQKLIKRVVIAVDADPAGRHGGEILIGACLSVGVDFELYQASAEDRDFADDAKDGLAMGDPIPVDMRPIEPELPLASPLPDPSEPILGALPDSLLPKSLAELSADAPKWRPSGYTKPVIQLDTGEMASIVRKVEHELINEGIGLYQYGEIIVRVGRQPLQLKAGELTYSAKLVQLKAHDLLYHLNDNVSFTKYNATAKKQVPIDCPEWIARTYLERRGAWNLAPLMGVTPIPLIRPDGTILDKPGYDPTTRLIFEPMGTAFPTINTNADIDLARDSAAMLYDLIKTFPFADSASLAVALSAIMSVVMRRSIPTCPMIIFNAPVASSGKSKMLDICSIIGTGHPAAKLGVGNNPEEFQKRLDSALIQGEMMIAFDNVQVHVDSDTLCTMLTEPITAVRVLGASSLVSVPNTATVMMTGNNIVIVGDLNRRSIMCTIDPKDPRPELRDFSQYEDVIARTMRQRPELVAACMHIVLAYRNAGSPKTGLPPLGSFEPWCNWVRDPLVWLGFEDPVASMETTRQTDPDLESMQAVMYAWSRIWPPGTRTSTSEVIDAANKIATGGSVIDDRKYVYGDLREALIAVAGSGNGGTLINPKRLGRWLSAKKNRILQLDAEHGRLQFVKAGETAGIPYWKLDRTE